MKNLWINIKDENNDKFSKYVSDSCLNFTIKYYDKFSQKEVKFKGILDNWAEENCLGKFIITTLGAYFEYKEDKIKFILRWV